MKAALVLGGYFDSTKDSSSKGFDGFQHIKKNIIEKIETDFFIHSWQPEIKNTLVDLYNPKSIISETQIDFSHILSERNLYQKNLNFFENMGRLSSDKFSQFYSLSKAFELVGNYEKKVEKDYDIVIKGRFDLGRINRNTSIEFPVQCINFDKDLDMSKIYFAYWNQLEYGPADMWWYSNSKNMRKFAKLYNKSLNDYWHIGSNFYNSFSDDQKFQIFNIHCVLKQFLIDNDLWEKSSFLKTIWE